MNLAIFSQVSLSQYPGAIVVGAIAPDLPIFVFYFYSKWVLRRSEREIWTEGYWHPRLQNIVAILHSIPLAILGAIACHVFNFMEGKIFCLSILLHCFGDLPVHHDDAHRHFFPFSSYRFISPFSYWDPNHYGRWVASVELAIVLLASVQILPIFTHAIARGAIVAINSFYAFFYSRYYLIPLLRKLGPS